MAEPRATRPGPAATGFQVANSLTGDERLVVLNRPSVQHPCDYETTGETTALQSRNVPLWRYA
jgi:hypothetical protein